LQNSIRIRRIKENCNYKLKEKGSLFHGFAIKVTSTNEAIKRLQELKNIYFDATHHCYAYKTSYQEEKYSDDGEPNGTAGIRILNAINHFSLTDLLAVIVRYFGGTKLGVGPLGKAYAETSLSLLSSVEHIEFTKFKEVEIQYDFSHTSKIHYCLNKYKAKKISNSFDNNPLINCYLEPYRIHSFINELRESTNGNVKIEHLNNEIYLSF